MKKTITVVILLALLLACGQKNEAPSSSTSSPKSMVQKEATPLGIGEIKSVTLNDPLNQEMVKKGMAIYEMKCAACHKLKGSRIVGPSWAGITSKRKPEWIMNMITNVEVMLEKDPEARKLLEECLTRMPNQNVSVGDARDLLEFIYQNDIDNPAK